MFSKYEYLRAGASMKLISLENFCLFSISLSDMRARKLGIVFSLISRSIGFLWSSYLGKIYP